MPENLKAKTVVNIGYTGVARVLTFAVSAAASIILAQNLSPIDYGIVGFATIFIGFLSQFSDLGIGSAVIQKANLDEKGLYTGFTIRLILGTIIFALAIVLSPLAKIFFDNNAVVVVIQVLAINFLLTSFVFLPTSLLQRDLNYRKLSISNICSSVVSSIVAIILALVGYKYWSIVIGNLSSGLANILIVNLLKPVTIRFRLDRRIASEFIHFGGNLFLVGFLVYAVFNMDNFIIGTVKGAGQLGYYAIAFSWGSMVCGILYSIIHSVLFPTFSTFQDDKERLKRNYLRILEYVIFIGVLANVTLFLVAPEFLFFILGRGNDKWLPALAAFKILCIYGIFRAFLEPVANVFLALGKPNVLVKSNAITGIIELGLLYPAIVYLGIEGAAIVVTIVYALNYLICFPFLKRELNINYGEVWAVAKPTIISACAAMLSIYTYSKILRRNSIFFLFEETFLCILFFTISYGIITKWRLIKETRSIIRNIKFEKM